MTCRIALNLALSCTSASFCSPLVGAQATARIPERLAEVSAERLGMDRVYEVHVRGDGSAAVVGSGRTIAALVDANGRVLTTIPAPQIGSISGIPRSGLVGDHLWLMVPLANELVVFNESGSIARRVRTDHTPVLPSGEEAPVVPPGGMMGPIALGLLPDDGLLLQVMSPSAYPVPADWARIDGATSALLRVDSRGIVRGFIGWLPRESRCYFGGVRLPYCRARLDERAPDASSLAAIVLDESPSGDSIGVTIRMRNAVGEVAYTRLEWIEGTPLDQKVLDSAMARIVASPRRTPLPTARRDSLLKAYRPRFLPAVEEAIIGSDGRVWLRMPSRPGAVRYRVIERDGRNAATLEFPEDVRVLGANGSRAWSLKAGAGAGTIMVFSL